MKERVCTFTKSGPAKIIAVSISFPMLCHSVGCGTPGEMPPAMQSITRSFSTVHMMQSSAFMMRLAT
ncbi:MAG: hypothetical protein DME52_03270 [Verrucomicrobia bacterium]|nr:MAG: hypothetical protein DME84_08430 [Verrucomicrobiota bacterium]PYK27664.1 MAG: hypothetical protein DME52_03270 [Verrucomicrobiota bacterium]PYK48618.1 MAG: hypothetical protein DME51_10970 [Verrucomicrobiota bacterium]